MSFINVKQAVSEQFTKMLATNLVLTTNADKDEMWDTYLKIGTEQGINEIFRERGALECNCCRRYIRAAGGSVAFIGGELVTMWDVTVGGEYQPIVDALAAMVRQANIETIFLHEFKTVGVDKTPDEHTDIIWDHFFMKLPAAFVKPKSQIATLKGKAANNYNVLKRSLDEITFTAIESVTDLIESKSIYKGEENKNRVIQLKKLKDEYTKVMLEDSSNDGCAWQEFIWENSIRLGEASAFRNSVIGTLLVDLSEGMDLEVAVKSYETKVAPENYKRSSALITQAMINRAEATIVELGLENSIQRRHAVTEDITINDVLFADRSAKAAMGVLSGLKPTAAKEVKTGTAKDISIAEFLSTVVPKTDSMELLVTSEHQANFMSLVAPVNTDRPAITKWNNNFSWSYNGEIADSSMRQNVKAKGGNVDGVLRFSIQWNTPDRPYGRDLDAHCQCKGEHIYYGNRHGNSNSGILDVDIMAPRGVAVENIIYTDLNRMPDGDYNLSVNNYSSTTNNHGFTAEVGFEGKTLCFDHTASMRGDQTVPVATVNKKNGKFTLISGNPVSESSVEVYGIQPKEFHKVSLLMNSPNFWDCVENPKGNKHWFFILDKCINKEPVRGFYNEFLKDELHNDRKVFEHLGAQMRVPFTDQQLSGLGFSSTQENIVTVKIKGEVNGLFNIKFN